MLDGQAPVRHGAAHPCTRPPRMGAASHGADPPGEPALEVSGPARHYTPERTAMRQKTWSESLPHRPDEPDRDAALERDRPRSSGRGRPIAVSAVALIAAALIIVILAAGL
jgi:hypothetical protein